MSMLIWNIHRLDTKSTVIRFRSFLALKKIAVITDSKLNEGTSMKLEKEDAENCKRKEL